MLRGHPTLTLPIHSERSEVGKHIPLPFIEQDGVFIFHHDLLFDLSGCIITYHKFIAIGYTKLNLVPTLANYGHTIRYLMLFHLSVVQALLW